MDKITAMACSVTDFTVSRRRDRVAGAVYPVGTLAGDAVTVVAGAATWAMFAFMLHVRLTVVDPFA